VDEALHNIVDAISGWLTVHIEQSLNASRLSVSASATQSLTFSVQLP
jgi:hypothetical protein